MGFEVIFAISADDDLEAINEYISQENPIAAEKISKKLVETALSLEYQPLRYPIHRKGKPHRKMVVSGTPYLIFYRIDELQRIVRVVHFWHGARRSPKLQNQKPR